MHFRLRIQRAALGLAGAMPLLVWGAPPATGDPRDFVLNPTLSAGTAFGGDTLATYGVWDPWIGKPDSTNLNAGDGFYTYGGVSMRWPQRGFSLHLQGGRMGMTITDYGDGSGYGSFVRWPVELIGTYQWNRFRAGFGLTHHYSPIFKDEAGAGASIEFADAAGSVFETEYVFSRFSAIVRYVTIDYESAAGIVDGDHIALGFTLRFGPAW